MEFEEVTNYLLETWNDQDTIDMFNQQENTVSSSSEPCNNSEMNPPINFTLSSSSSDDDVTSSSATIATVTPTVKKRPSSIVRAKNVKRSRKADRLIVADNAMLSEATRCQSVDEMIRLACLHRYNVDNLEMLEWSEAVLLQLCHLEKELDLKLLDWSYVKRILENQWCYEIVIPLQQYIGSRETLSHIVMKNRAHKMKHGLLQSRERMFTSPPVINYRLLRTYVTAPMINVYRENLFRKKIDL